MKTNSFVRWACIGALSLAAASAYGQLWVSGDNTSSSSEANRSFGHQFTVGGSAVTLYALGVFIGGGEPTDGVQIRLWDSGNNVVASQQFGPGVTANSFVDGSGNWRYYNLLTPISLNAGGSYTLSYWSSTSQNVGIAPPNGAPSFNSPGITYVQDVIANGFGDVIPQDAAGSSVYKGPNMIVPEPETYAFIAGLGLVGYGLYRRRQDFRG